ncbi:N-acetyltransferase [Kocuria tytonicola]|uniref:GNAT family N-acetyltransferase n=1 Tax=Kocuria tytonicola TaxID=2055946 RepID=UPI000EF9050F|nr:GNAT family N-acetyltransferase [Kocuria tytonicola]RLZ03357.1 N-acetyltransferase [Kocuria tytonicola]
MIETPRLLLRRPRPADVDAVHAYRSRADVARYLSAGTWSQQKTDEELRAYATAQLNGPGDELVLLAELRTTRGIVGEVGLTWADSHDAAEIGYVFNPAYGGRGLATEAVSGVISAALGAWGFAQVSARTDVDNRTSRLLCERVGMTLTAHSLSTDGRNVEEVTYTTSDVR